MHAKSGVERVLRGAAVVSIVSLAWAIAAEEEKPRSPAETQVRQSLTGVWRGFVVNGTGEDPTRGPVKLVLKVNANAIQGTQIKGQQEVDHGQGSYELVLDSNPRQLDGHPLVERGNRSPWLGIYELDGDTLKWCVGKRERPTAFETVKGQFLMILKADRE